MSNIDFVNKTNTPESEKDLWQTPANIFRALDKEFNFKLDVCADEKKGERGHRRDHADQGRPLLPGRK